MKEFIIRLNDATEEEIIEVKKACESIVKKYGGDFYTKQMITDKRQGQLTITERKFDRNVVLMDDRAQR